MKKNKMLFTCLLLLLFATYSCAIEELQPEPASISSQILKNVNPVFLEHDLSRYKIKPIWKSAVVFKSSSANKRTKFKDAVEVNFTQDKKTTIPLSKNGKIRGRQRLLLTFDNGKIRETIIEYIPSDDFMGDIKDINSGNFKSKQFDGEITFKYLGKNSGITWVLSKGIVVKKLKRTEIISKQKKTRQNAKSTELVCTIRQVVYEICLENGAGEAMHCWTDTKDAEDCVWVEPVPVLPPPDAETPPSDGDPFDCAENPSWPWCQDGGIGDPPTDPPVEEQCSLDKFETSVNSINVDDQIVSINLDEETDETYSKFYSWRCLKGNYYDVISTEIGVIKKTHNPTSPKEWESLTHVSLSPKGLLVCGSVTITSSAGIGTVGIHNATMALSVGLNVTTEAAGTPINRYMYFNPIKHFNVND